MKNRRLQGILMAGVLLLGAGAAGAATPAGDAEVARKVIHEIRMYSNYSLWDNINISVREGAVELTGEVNQPWKKADLGRLVQRVAGVTAVTNQLKVLPPSSFDDRLRLQVARAIYGHPALSRYGIQAVPPIHIIVENGRVTLEGVVNNDMEKQIAGMRASSAGLSFGAVTNNLRVENPAARRG